MDTSWRHTQGASGAVDESAMESGDWRAQLQRQRIVNKILDTLKRHLPFSGYERLQELKKIAERVEQEIYTAATSHSEYSQKICLHMLTMETRLQNHMPDSMRSNSAANGVNPSVPLDSTAQTSNSNGGDWEEEVYQKIQDMKDLYLLYLRPTEGASAAVGNPALEFGGWRAQLQADSRKSIVNKIMDIFKRHIPLSGNEELQELKEIAVTFEATMYTSATSQSEYLRKTSLEKLTKKTGSQNPLLDPMQSNSAANSVNPWVTLNSTAKIGSPNGRDREEEVHQKIRATKDPYTLDSRPIQGVSGAVGGPIVESSDWRAQLQADLRLRIVNKISDTLQRHFPFFGHEGLQEVKKIAVRFEQKIYTAATSQV
ncbi:hypothetical protein L1987_55912 [Smallanthus sonchifolius]|uniref:Uncharacterized protein n=1 Tax=Smallanthus sonchifolius TaxID=185202 RepID=A0ACB9EAX1_9ASTR|nr:hypothetical protein L1987_55912 [Smallanthus sonchifolius]